MSRRVLIVDDSPVMRNLLEQATTSAGEVTVDQAEDGVAALKTIRTAKDPYDLVFLDLNMPLMDGMKLLSYLRQEQDLGKTSVAVVTTEQSEDTELQARSLGATHFLRKPVTQDMVNDVLREVLNLDTPGG